MGRPSLAFAAGLGATVGIILLVFATGQTFGQRCERLHPVDTAAQEACVDRLVRGAR